MGRHRDEESYSSVAGGDVRITSFNHVSSEQAPKQYLHSTFLKEVQLRSLVLPALSLMCKKRAGRSKNAAFYNANFKSRITSLGAKVNSEKGTG